MRRQEEDREGELLLSRGERKSTWIWIGGGGESGGSVQVWEGRLVGTESGGSLARCHLSGAAVIATQGQFGILPFAKIFFY